MVGRQREAELAIQCALERGEVVVGDVGDGSAAVADEVGVAVFAQVVDRWSDARVNVFDQFELAETLDHSVDGGRCDVREPGFDLVNEIFGGQVVVSVGQHSDHGASGAGETST